jgi:hypothetical protein
MTTTETVYFIGNNCLALIALTVVAVTFAAGKMLH